MPCTAASPSPRPVNFVEKKGSKILSSRLRIHRQPVSCTSTATYCPAGLTPPEIVSQVWPRPPPAIGGDQDGPVLSLVMASAPLITRFMMSCCIWLGSARTGGRFGELEPKLHGFGIDDWIRPLISRTSADISSSGDEVALARVSESWLVRSRSLLAGVHHVLEQRVIRTRAGIGDPRARLAFPRIPTSRLLKSCATPPAIMPRLSSFCVSRNCSSALSFGDVARDHRSPDDSPRRP